MSSDRGGLVQARVSKSGSGGGWLAALGFAVASGVGWLLLVSTVPASATASEPCGAHGTLTYSAPQYTCTYTAAGSDRFVVPAGVSKVVVHAVGAAGGSGSGNSNYSASPSSGGLGADVSATLPVTGGKTLQVNVGAPGSAGGDGAAGSNTGGGGGGESDVRDGSYGLHDRLLVAGGGGGGGGWGGGCFNDNGQEICGADTGASGGASGSAGATPAGGSANGAGDGGQPGTKTAGGAGGAGGNAPSGEQGSAGSAGSNGSRGTGGAGGGQGGAGGDGYFGGGGGGGGSTVSTVQQASVSPGGGGGGGSSYVEPGAGATHIRSASAGEGPEVVISWSKPALPTVSTLAPREGPDSGGSVVRVIGSHLLGAKAVRFGTMPAKIDKIVSANELKVTTPRGSGTVNVTVTTRSGTSATTTADRYTYVSRPAVTGLSPDHGRHSGGAAVTITGSNLSSARRVDFGAVPATIDKVVSGTELKVTTPKGSGTVDVTVSTAGGTSAKTAADRYTY